MARRHLGGASGPHPLARAAFDAVMTTPNQIHKQRADVQVTAADLLAFGPQKPITEKACGTTSMSASSTWARGSPAAAAFRFIT